jgi:hypothetical protein
MSSMITTRHSRTGRLFGGMLLSLLVLVCAGCSAVGGTPTIPTIAITPGGTPRTLPHYDHIVVVVEENHSYGDIVGASDAPYLASLAQQGAVFTHSYAITHPSEPNYLALFAGSTFGVASDDCPLQFGGPNLASALIGHGMSFTGYSEDMPSAGYTGCRAGGASSDPLYARKHNPWVDFANVPAESNQPFTSFPSDFSQLPTVSFVVPNQVHDMHSASIADGDTWLQQNMDAYAQWAPAHNSLLIVTWDEDDGSQSNQVLTLFVGAHVQPGQYGETINHYSVLRTIEALTGAPFTNHAADATTIADIWGA